MTPRRSSHFVSDAICIGVFLVVWACLMFFVCRGFLWGGSI